MINKYNFIAPFYALLSRLVYGDSLLQIQIKLIKTLPQQGNLLIMGGGNGEILPYIIKHSPNLKIDYIEASDKMIALAKQNVVQHQQLQFIHADKIPENTKTYNAVYAAFFLDLFTLSEINEWLTTFEEKSTKEYTLHIADFQLNKDVENSVLRKMQIKTSILFFKITTQHRTRFLPNTFSAIKKRNYNSLYKSTLKGNFLCAEVFSRQ